MGCAESNGLVQVRLGITEISIGSTLKPTEAPIPIPIISGTHPEKLAHDVGGGQTPIGGAEIMTHPVTVAISIPISTETVIESPFKTSGALPNRRQIWTPTEAPTLEIIPADRDPNSPTSPPGDLFQKYTPPLVPKAASAPADAPTASVTVKSGIGERMRQPGTGPATVIVPTGGVATPRRLRSREPCAVIRPAPFNAPRRIVSSPK